MRGQLAILRAAQRRLQQRLLATLSQNYALIVSMQELKRQLSQQKLAKDEEIRRLGLEISALRHLRQFTYIVRPLF
ncbi:hypothetical protein ISF_10033 [Cordyceps fumosorosea ARSEF 2679]|uniref:Uncharacterized protein n=1 Tax=Cordyceps fumosorosea (strain ARSEF 2679) TaxID=1081104 RepID=A0A166VU19_CORFA|nr:hypothetical protein ISF_10033 [Cordyceps fumosorosea ARSEF 2679]OAA34029.1 hypothetical protein ISF_10033 [Cordyceps fumosorosea ARSEF 2679]